MKKRFSESQIVEILQEAEAALAAEIDSHLSQDLNRNRKNGYSSKTMKSDHGAFELNVPRDRKIFDISLL